MAGIVILNDDRTNDMSTEEQIVKLDSVDLEELSDRVAKRVEEKIMARALRWTLANAIVLLLAIIAGLSGFFDLKADVRLNQAMNLAQETRIDRSDMKTEYVRNELSSKLDALNRKLDELNAYLRDHNGKRQ